MVLVDLLQASLSFKSGNSPEMQKLKNKEKKKKERGEGERSSKERRKVSEMLKFPRDEKGKRNYLIFFSYIILRY